MPTDTPISLEAKKPERYSTIQVSKKLAKGFKIGSKARVIVSGEVKGISECYGDKELYDVTIRNPETSMESQDNSADIEIKKMMEE